MEYDVQRATRHCTATGRELAPGETFFSALVAEGNELRRLDYSAAAWQGAPQEAIAWWKSQVPSGGGRARWAPNDVMLHCFDELAAQPERQDIRYLLALLLVRRRVMRMEENQQDQQGHEVLVLYCPRRDATYKVPVVTPQDPGRIEEVQQELARLLE